MKSAMKDTLMLDEDISVVPIPSLPLSCTIDLRLVNYCHARSF